ncbi:(E3-independent) E2 ubiquitin-conjugating enzyme-like [Sinocyclocheilus grahami]|uniref:(E3-independent) E2 ubiquitin-conjugating enzyme-like n=1 Tax=Sinocyclocheilus grahami TaxID=75366 RepID=UPI0007AD0516|nr:PREDICTED: (E3-independent) E2 ubiquitin-conjugating enzyme-like [Sinocyclocheilus grahami]
MAAKSAKQGKKEQKAEACGDDGKDVSMAAIANILEDHQAALSADFKATVSTLEVQLDQIQATVTEHGSKIASLKTHANSQDERTHALETTCAMLKESNSKLLAKLVNLEFRSRRNNIRIIGLPESIEGPRPSVVFSELLAEVFGDGVLESPPECDRAHRSLADKPRPGERGLGLLLVKRLGYFDHTQRQLGERALYVFPAKSETIRITCDGLEGAPAHPEDPVVRKLKRMYKKEVGKKITENADTQSNDSESTEKMEGTEGEKRSVQEQDCPDDNSVPCYPNNGPFPCQDALEEGKEPPLDVLQGQWAHLGEQESNEEPGDDTDDTSSVTSSASSTASLQSGPIRKKSIPLSIRNLKRKHKKKRTTFSREFKPGDR